MNPGEDCRQRRRSSELSHPVTTDPVAGELSTVFEASTRLTISEVAASLSKGVVGETMAPGRTGRFSGTSPGGGEVLVADITVWFCDGISKEGS